MKFKIIIEVKALENACLAKLQNPKNEIVNFTISKSEVNKLANWGLICKSDNSANDKDVYVGELAFIEEENL